MSVMSNVHIDPEFDDLIPRMPDPDYQSFLNSVKEHGFDKPVIDVLPNGAILDGRHRFLVAQKLGGAFKTQLRYRVKEFNREQAIDYVVRSNKNRNNLTKAQLAAIASERLRLVSKYREKAKENLNVNTGNRYKNLALGSVEPSARKKVTPHHANEEVAKELGISKASVTRMNKVNKEDRQAFQRVMDGEETVRHAYDNLPSQKAKQAEKKRVQEKKTKATPVKQGSKKTDLHPKQWEPIETHDEYEKSQAELNRNYSTLKTPTEFLNLRTEGKQDAFMAAINIKDLFPDTASIIEDYHDGIADAWDVIEKSFPDLADYLKTNFNYLYDVMNHK